ncbi:MAG: hypothetical protein ACXAC8_06720 [Candidatus Hodarchaeales archaeon]|jgi:hypothetical protein
MALVKVKRWLDQMNMKYKVKNSNVLLLYNVNGIRFAVIVTSLENWIRIAALIIRAEEIPKEKKGEIFADLLRTNWELNEVTYSIDPKGAIFSENVVLVDSNFENFKSEFSAVVFGVTHFVRNIGPKYGLEKPSNEWINV